MEPVPGVSHGPIGTLTRRCGRDDKRRPPTRGLGKNPVLVFVAWVELIATYEGEHTRRNRHVLSVPRRGIRRVFAASAAGAKETTSTRGSASLDA